MLDLSRRGVYEELGVRSDIYWKLCCWVEFGSVTT